MNLSATARGLGFTIIFLLLEPPQEDDEADHDLFFLLLKNLDGS